MAGLIVSVIAWLLTGPLRGLPLPWRLGTVGITLAIVVLRELNLVRFPVPQRQRQIDRSKLNDPGPFMGPFRFGMEMGSGLKTYLPSALPHFTFVALVFLVDSLTIALLVGALFGAGRSMVAITEYQRPRLPGQAIELALGRVRAVSLGSAVVAGVGLIVRGLPW